LQVQQRDKEKISSWAEGAKKTYSRRSVWGGEKKKKWVAKVVGKVTQRRRGGGPRVRASGGLHGGVVTKKCNRGDNKDGEKKLPSGQKGNSDEWRCAEIRPLTIKK